MPRLSPAGMRHVLGCLRSSARFRVEGDSMRPALCHGQHVLARRVRAGDGLYRRGELVVLRHPLDPSDVIIKRLVGLPGEHLRLGSDAVCVNDLPLAEPYLDGPPCPVNRHPREWVVGPDEWFVLGDNRADSQDSRAFGPVSRELVLGRVWLRCWPPQAWGRVSVPGTLLGGAQG